MFGFVISFLTSKATSGSCRCKEFASSRRQVRCTRLPRRLLRSVPLIGEVLDPACPPSQDHYRTTQYLQSTQSAVFILKCISDSEKELLPKGATYFGNKAIAGMTLQILKAPAAASPTPSNWVTLRKLSLFRQSACQCNSGTGGLHLRNGVASLYWPLSRQYSMSMRVCPAKSHEGTSHMGRSS